jgi:hypothetical protein
MNIPAIFIAREFHCEECKAFTDVYLTDCLLSTPPEIVEAWVSDLRDHIREAHPERAKYFNI